MLKKHKTHNFAYKDSMGVLHQLSFEPHSYPNLMEYIRDQGFEDWGDCRGRAWCGTCHVKTSENANLPIENEDEQHCLLVLPNNQNGSRLACQILMDENIRELEFEYLGDN